MISASLGPLAQLVEQKTFNLLVISSNLIRPTIPKRCSLEVPEGPLAQLVEQKTFNLLVISSNLIRPTIFHALVAQLDRVLGFEPRCREFESLRAHHIYLKKDLSSNIFFLERLERRFF